MHDGLDTQSVSPRFPFSLTSQSHRQWGDVFPQPKGLMMIQNSETRFYRERMSMAELLQAGEAISKSQMFGCSNVSQGVVIAEFCDANNLSWLEWLADFSMGNGKIQMKSEAMLRRLRSLGGDFIWKTESNDTAKAVIEITYKGKTADATFGDEQAERAGLLKKDTYKNYRSEMYRARAASIGVRMVCPEALGGFIAEAECDDAPNQSGGEPTVSERLAETVEQPKRGPGRPKKNAGDETQQATTVAPAAPAAPASQSIPAPAADVSETKVEQTGSAGQPSVESQPQSAGVENPPAVDPRIQAIKDCAEYKKELGISDQNWAKIMEMINCPADENGKRTLMNADEPTIRKMLAWLIKQSEAKRAKDADKSAEQWAANGMPTGTAAVV